MCKRPILVALAVSVVLGAGACTNKLSSSLTVDSESFEPDSCRSGQTWGFAGVELAREASDQLKLRLVLEPTGKAKVILFKGGEPIELGACATMAFERQKSTINNITNVKGAATLACSAGGHSVNGQVSFENCH